MSQALCPTPVSRRQELYDALVERRKSHHFPDGLLNPSQIADGRYDSNHLGPWSRWQGSLDAEVVVVGQDWGDLPYFLENQGLDSDSELTCVNLRALALEAGWDLGTPHAPAATSLFFTNAVLGIRKESGKSGKPPTPWVDDSTPFLVDLLAIIRPKAVVSLGASAFRACRLAILGRQRHQRLPLGLPVGRAHACSPIQIPNMPTWFAFYHCGPLGMANHPYNLQVEDWRQLGRWKITKGL